MLALAALSITLVQAAERSDSGAGEGETAAQTIVVTGTRIALSESELTTPTIVLGPETLKLRGAGTIADSLESLPQMRNFQTEGTGSLVFGVGAGRGFANLRGLGPYRTLVLLDGKRLVSNTLSAQPDLSLLPSALVSRVEVAATGASAVYGSDAIGGVVNFVLNTDFKGSELDAGGGASSRGDATEGRFSFIHGGDFGGQFRLLASADYYHRTGLSPGSRSFATPSQIVPNPQFSPGGGQRPLIVASNAYDAGQSYGGLILNGPLAGH